MKEDLTHCFADSLLAFETTLPTPPAPQPSAMEVPPVPSPLGTLLSAPDC